jgi:hypothetical protein
VYGEGRSRTWQADDDDVLIAVIDAALQNNQAGRMFWLRWNRFVGS